MLKTTPLCLFSIVVVQFAEARSAWAETLHLRMESTAAPAQADEAATEILGSFIYPLGKIPEDRPIFENRNSRMALVSGTSVYQSNHKLHIRDTRGTENKLPGNDALKWAVSRARMDLFVSE